MPRIIKEAIGPITTTASTVRRSPTCWKRWATRPDPRARVFSLPLLRDVFPMPEHEDQIDMDALQATAQLLACLPIMTIRPKPAVMKGILFPLYNGLHHGRARNCRRSESSSK